MGLRNVFTHDCEGIFGSIIDGFLGQNSMSTNLSTKGINIRLIISIGYVKRKVYN